ncbi:MAG: 7-cyano-7-deazaguanine synthase QueC [Victivallales bacterium]|nr:7-cyano-7-deazaguanine synthase QueC [Victivallales bacterium]MCF7888651.1 7-cyano-7-deazaguanine synthase QueC [Victivallales bacterium]
MEEVFNKEDALVLLSGGQDSTTCLYWALKKFQKVSAISFRYGQKHSIETAVAEGICREASVSLKVIDISFMKNLVVSNLFENTEDVGGKHPLNEEVPSSYVPYRNMIFLTLAAAWGSTIGARHLVTGVCETDFSGYADCRDVFIKSLQVSLNLAADFKDNGNVIHTPLMWLTKAEEFRLAEELDCMDVIINKTITCYNGVTEMNDFGMGCGNCPSCKLRRKGYEEYVGKYKQ